MKSIKLRRVLPLLIYYPACLVVLAVVAYPVVWMLLSSLKKTWEVLQSPFALPLQPTPDNYVKAWQVAKFGRSFLNSTFVTSVSISGILLISTMAGYVFAKLDFRGKNFLLYFWLTGMMSHPTSL